MPAWLVFILSAAAVVVAGMRIARAGDTIAERTGLGKTWVGVLLIAATTSLPELTTGIFAVRQGTADLAIGDLFGAGMTNMLILAVADLALMYRRVLTRVAINQALVGTLAICLATIGAAGILTGPHLTWLGVGWAPLLIGVSYIAGMRLIYLNRAGPPFMAPGEATGAARRAPGLKPALVSFGLAAAVILVASRYLASSAAEVAEQVGISTGFMGVAVVPLTTSLPEVAVTFVAVRAGSYDLAVGNLLGSSSFNIAILLPLDVMDGNGSLLLQSGPSVTVAALFAVLLMGQTVIEILNKAERRIWFLEPDAVFRVLTYALGLYLSYRVQL